MTLKHTDFFDSPVMRELARKAIKDGTIKPTTDEIIKSAAEKKSIAVTGDLFTDLVRLSEGLRSKGYTREAQALEAKIVAYKRAEQEFSSELSAAHPDGDVMMGEASNGLGDVETLESAHRKIVEVVNKTPTGKFAMNEGILGAVAGVFKLGADELIDPTESDSSAETAAEAFSPELQKKRVNIQKINEFLAEKFPQIASSVSQAIAVTGVNSNAKDGRSMLSFQPEAILHPGASEAYIASYAVFAGNAGVSSLVKQYKELANHVYGPEAQVMTSEVIAARINAYSSAPADLVTWGNFIQPGLGNQYFQGSQDTEERRELVQDPKNANDPMFAANRNSIWQPYGGKWEFNVLKMQPEMVGRAWKMRPEMVAWVANHIQTIMRAKYDQCVGEAIIKNANDALKAEVDKQLKPLQSVVVYFSSPKVLDPQSGSSAAISKSLVTAKKILLRYIDGVGFKQLTQLLSPFVGKWDQPMKNSIVAAVESIDAALQFISANLVNKGDAIVVDAASSMYKSLRGAAEMWYSASQKVNDKALAKRYEANANETIALANAIKAAEGQPYAAVYDSAVKNAFPKAKTFEQLQQEVANWVSFTSKKTGLPADEYVVASTKNGLVKESVLGDQMESGSTKPTSKGTTQGGSSLSVDEKRAVQEMQFALITLAQYVQSNMTGFPKSGRDAPSILLSVGKKKTQADMDGAWGPNTSSALKKASDILNEWNETHPNKMVNNNLNVQQMMRQPTVIAEAKKNTATLIQLLSRVGADLTGIASQENIVVYDKLPIDINWNRWDQPLGTIPINSSDLASLGAMYDLVTKNGWMQPKYAEDPSGFTVEGFTAQMWISLTQWFQRRAQFLHNAYVYTDKASVPTARAYYAAAKRLEVQLMTHVKRVQIDLNMPNQVLLGVDSIPGARPSGGQGYDYGQRQEQSGRPGRSGEPAGAAYQEGVEGEDLQTRSGKAGPPIYSNGNIDLTTGWYPELMEETGIKYNFLNYRTFGSATGAQLAKMFYPAENNPIPLYARFLNTLNVHIADAIDRWTSARPGPNADQRSTMMELAADWQAVIDRQKKSIKQYVNLVG